MSKSLSSDIVFLGYKRTAFGTFSGSLKHLSATDLAVHASKAALEQAGVPAEDVDHVVFGNVQQTSKDAIYLARHVGLRSGLPTKTPAVTVNRLCGSGFEAITAGAREILIGDAEVVLCGGTESMSQAPHVVRGARDGLRFGQAPEFEDTLWSSLTDSYTGMPMAITAENLAEQYGISREDCDAYAARSQAAWQHAQEMGWYAEEIAPIELKTRKGVVAFDRDEHPRPSTADQLAKLKPVFKKDGVVTAGNASGICDGAAALVIATSSYAEEKGLTPIGRLVQWGVAGVDPTIMGIGPVPAAQAALERAGLTIEDMDVIEVNEAFAPQYLAVEKALGLPREKTNVNGGAIALGHPLGASGARITGHLLYELKRRGGRYALGSACIGGGQGIAVIVEAI
ncbi:MAG: acetyl-CoA C-acetyltransferase [Myxococcales bacterium]|nr:acetyl-CoA C-acetyltransferase [Myxococcales bacterium]